MPTSSAPTTATLGLHHRATATTVLLGATPILIGRDQECALRLPGQLVSRFHATVEAADGQHLLRDLGSTNGTYLNGVKIAAEQVFALRHGDLVEMGEERLTVIDESAADGDIVRDDGSEHDVLDLQRDGGASQVGRSAVSALQEEVSTLLARSPGDLHGVLDALRSRLSARMLVLYRSSGDALEPAETSGAPDDVGLDGRLATLAGRATTTGRALLLHGHGKPDSDEPPAAATGVHDQWSAAAVPLAGAVLVAVKTGRARLDRQDLVVLAVLAGSVAGALGASAVAVEGLAARERSAGTAKLAAYAPRDRSPIGERA